MERYYFEVIKEGGFMEAVMYAIYIKNILLF